MITLTFLWKTGWQGGMLGSSWVVRVNGSVDGLEEGGHRKWWPSGQVPHLWKVEVVRRATELDQGSKGRELRMALRSSE